MFSLTDIRSFEALVRLLRINLDVQTFTRHLNEASAPGKQSKYDGSFPSWIINFSVKRAGGLMETLDALVGKINAFAWGPPMLILLVGTGFWLTINLRGLQFTKLS